MMRSGIIIFLLIIVFSGVQCSSGDEPETITCDTDYSLATDVMPIIETRCAISGCHNGTRSPDLRTKQVVIAQETSIRSQVKSGRMPKNSKLNSSQVAAIVCWVEQGALDN
jgi:hypothetical protein